MPSRVAWAWLVLVPAMAHAQEQVGGAVRSFKPTRTGDPALGIIVVVSLVVIVVVGYFFRDWFGRWFERGVTLVFTPVVFVLAPVLTLLGRVFVFAGDKFFQALGAPARRRERREDAAYRRDEAEWDAQFRGWAEPRLAARFPHADSAYLAEIARRMERPRREAVGEFRGDLFTQRVYWNGNLGGDRLDIYYGDKCLYSLPVEIAKLGEKGLAKTGG